jgi:hypothetical protein
LVFARSLLSDPFATKVQKNEKKTEKKTEKKKVKQRSFESGGPPKKTNHKSKKKCGA